VVENPTERHVEAQRIDCCARPRTFADDVVVRKYAGDGDRWAAERTVRERLTGWLDGKALLDVGVGGGRMTAAYGHLVATYVGLDYAQPMVDACRARFAGVPNLTFVLGDVRKMGQFDPDSFDFVLCACNGLDYISHSDRGVALREIHRVSKPGAVFFFSTHNLLHLPELFRLKLGARPTVGAKIHRLVQYGGLHVLNFPSARLMRLPHATVNDGGLGFRLRTHYVTPDEQLRQLEEAGFTDIEIYLEDGTVVPNSKAGEASDWVLHFLARRPDQPGGDLHSHDAGS